MALLKCRPVFHYFVPLAVSTITFDILEHVHVPVKVERTMVRQSKLEKF